MKYIEGLALLYPGMKQYRYALRIIGSDKTLNIWSIQPNLSQLAAAIDAHDSPRIMLNTVEYGPTLAHRDHVLISLPEPVGKPT